MEWHRKDKGRQRTSAPALSVGAQARRRSGRSDTPTCTAQPVVTNLNQHGPYRLGSTRLWCVVCGRRGVAGRRQAWTRQQGGRRTMAGSMGGNMMAGSRAAARGVGAAAAAVSGATAGARAAGAAGAAGGGAGGAGEGEFRRWAPPAGLGHARFPEDSRAALAIPEGGLR